MFLCKFNILHTGGASPSPTTENLNFVRRRHFKQKFIFEKVYTPLTNAKCMI